MSTVLRILTGLLALAATQCAIADDNYPNKPVTIIVPQAAGGANDAIALSDRTEAQRAVGQTFIVDNRPGAAAMWAPWSRPGEARWLHPDDHGRQLDSDQSFALQEHGVRSGQDFQPVGTLATAGYVLVANPAFPARNVAEFDRAREATTKKSTSVRPVTAPSIT